MINRPGLHLGSIRGTQIFVDFSFMILAALFVFRDLEARQSLPHALLWIPLLVIGILAHELGHAAAIGAFKFGPSIIVLSGFGGVTMNQRRARPWQDIIISLAGPFTSFFLVIVANIAMSSLRVARTDPMLSELLPLLAKTNMMWGIFNLFPIFPLDGGQVVRNLGRAVTTDRRSMLFSAWSSILFGVLLFAAGVYIQDLMLGLVAAFLVFHNYQRIAAERDRSDSPYDDD